MSWKVVKIEPEVWRENYSENAFRAVFAKIKPSYLERISYGLLVVKEEDLLGENTELVEHVETVVGYVTVKELDAESVYWQYGGVMPQFRRSLDAYRCVEVAYKHQRDLEKSKRISTYVENNNQAMLRLYMTLGFLIVGTRLFQGQLLVDLLKEFDVERLQNPPEGLA